ncbi:MAG: hypothetical protein ACTHME_08130 [Candidatus Nitrosocosmicus sp.]
MKARFIMDITIALSDSHTLLKIGYKIALMLSIEVVQLSKKSPSAIRAEMLTNNITDFIMVS